MIQNFFAQGTGKKKLVNHLPTLKRLAKAGHITLHAQTGKKVSWYGQTTYAWYIEDYTSTAFGEFVIEYRSGSFFPYVYHIEN